MGSSKTYKSGERHRYDFSKKTNDDTTIQKNGIQVNKQQIDKS